MICSFEKPIVPLRTTCPPSTYSGLMDVQIVQKNCTVSIICGFYDVKMNKNKKFIKRKKENSCIGKRIHLYVKKLL
jgi:hypothetical protein